MTNHKHEGSKPKLGQYKLLKDLPTHPAGTKVVLYSDAHTSVRVRNGGKGIEFSKYMYKFLGDNDWFKYEGAER